VSGKLLADASMDDLLQALRRLDWQNELRQMGRSHWAEARHVVRYAYEDLHALHTHLEIVSPGWEAAAVLEIERVTGQLTALRDYMVKKPATVDRTASGD